jgi:hypothetical protein
MDYSKIDAQLAAYLKGTSGAEAISVFIYINKKLDELEKKYLEKYSISFTNEVPLVFSATVSTSAIDELSHQPWIKYFKMSTKMQPK